MINYSENVIVLSPGDTFIDSPDSLKIFLAGCMSAMEGDPYDWQGKFIDGLNRLSNPSSPQALLQFKGKKFIVCNPRSNKTRPERIMDNPEFVTSQNWKYDAMDYCDGIFCNFLKKSQDVLPMMDFGFIIKSGKAVIRCPEAYVNSGIIKYNCQRFQIPFLPEGRAGDVLSILQTMFTYVPRFQQVQGLTLPE